MPPRAVNADRQPWQLQSDDDLLAVGAPALGLRAGGRGVGANLHRTAVLCLGHEIFDALLSFGLRSIGQWARGLDKVRAAPYSGNRDCQAAGR